MDEVEPAPGPATWLRAIADGEADLAAGRTSDLDALIAEWAAEDAAPAAPSESRRRTAT